MNRRKKAVYDDDPEWLPGSNAEDADVQSELQAMSEGMDRNYYLRSQDMSVDAAPVEVRPKKPRTKAAKTAFVSDQESQLLEQLKQPAMNLEEKYRLLEARDKLIRLRLSKQARLEKGTVGSCPDMCPEKERLMREVQHQVSLFEGKAGKMNHHTAVKQYARSSADQEAPLPHELRPVKVLQMTMSYLLHKIVNLSETSDVNLGEWYHFLWDRTRGIRKDITQQDLCCLGSVALVEQCARFHIHCSARLAVEDSAVFDHKINTENLTKCLQTLKYMYYDLAVKAKGASDLVCQNEAEFRGYVVLLNLNDGNFMWEVQQLSTTIQQSAAIKFALRIHAALDKNNYVKFFKLVQSTTYLNACLLLRYFNQVRLSAMRTMLKSFSPRPPYTQYPIQELQQVLAFESDAEAIAFVEYCGLVVNTSRSHVLLDRRAFRQPEAAFVFDRALGVVEAKRGRSSVAEVIYNGGGGGALPSAAEFEQHRLCDSFDSSGYLRTVEVETAPEPRPQAKPQLEEAVEADAEAMEATDEAPKQEKEKEEDKQETTVIQTFTFKLPTASVAPSKPTFAFLPKKQPSPPPEVVSLPPPPPPPPPKTNEETLRQQVLERQRQLDEAAALKAKQRAEAEAAAAAAAAAAVLLQQRVQAQAQLQQQRQQLLLEESKKQQRLHEQQRRKQLQLHRDVGVVVGALVANVERAVHLEQGVAALTARRDSRLLGHCLRLWHQHATLAVRKRKTMDEGPCLLLWRPRLAASELHMPSQEAVLGDLKRYRAGRSLPPWPSKRLRTDEPRFQLRLFPGLGNALIARVLSSKQHRLATHLRWKIKLVCLDDGASKRLGSTMLLTNCRYQQTASLAGYRLDVSLETCRTIQRYDYFDGLVFVETTNTSGSNKQKILATLAEANCFLNLNAVVVTTAGTANRLQLDELPSSTDLQQYTVIHCHDNTNSMGNALQQALDWLSRRYMPPMVAIEADTLGSVMADCCGKEFWTAINKLPVDTTNYETIFRENIRRLSDILLDDLNFEYPNFPPEFLFNSETDEKIKTFDRPFPSNWRQTRPLIAQQLANILSTKANILSTKANYDQKMLVYYDPGELQRHKQSHWWLMFVQQRPTTATIDTKTIDTNEDDSFDLDDAWNKTMSTTVDSLEESATGSAATNNHRKQQMLELHDLMADLEASLDIQHKITVKIEERLNMAMK